MPGSAAVTGGATLAAAPPKPPAATRRVVSEDTYLRPGSFEQSLQKLAGKLDQKKLGQIPTESRRNVIIKESLTAISSKEQKEQDRWISQLNTALNINNPIEQMKKFEEIHLKLTRKS